MDYVSIYIKNNCEHKDPERPSKTSFDMDKLFELAELNGFDTARFRDSIKNPFHRGRVRMNIGNLIRGNFTRDGIIKGFDGETLSSDDLTQTY